MQIIGAGCILTGGSMPFWQFAAPTESGPMQDNLEAMRAELERTKALLNEVNHRTKNVFQLAVSVLSLEASNGVGRPAPLVLESASRRLMAMVECHDLLNQGDGRQVPIAAYLRRLREALSVGEGGPSIQVEADDIRLTHDEAMALGLFAFEAVTNSLKHAFPGGRPGIVSVRLARDGEGVVLTVTDDGVGMPDRRPRGLGHKLIEAFAAQLGGRYAAASEPGEGTALSLRFMSSSVKASAEAVSL